MEQAVIKFPEDKIMDLVKFVDINSQPLPEILEEMRKFDCFKENYIPMPVVEIRDSHVLDFIKKVCKALRSIVGQDLLISHLYVDFICMLEIRVLLEKYL